MGIDFTNLNKIKNFIQQAKLRSTQIDNNKDTTKFTSKEEALAFGLVVKGLKDGAEAQSVSNDGEVKAVTTSDIDKIVKEETLGYFGSEVSPAFTEDEISLENLMQFVDENVDIDKLNKYNEIAKNDKDGKIELSVEEMTALKEAGFDDDLVEVLLNDKNTAGSIAYIAKDILSGRAKQISDRAELMGELSDHRDVAMAGEIWAVAEHDRQMASVS